MDLFAVPPLAALLDLTYRGLMALTDLLSPLAGAGAAAAAIVLVTILVRAALIPAGISQARAEQTRARLAPRLRELQQRHRLDRERLQRETMQLYRDENASPFGGCLALVAQAPLVGLLYAIFLHPVIAGHPNALLTETLLGVPLGSSALGMLAGGVTLPAALVFGAVIVGVAVVGELTRRLFRPAATATALPASAAGVVGVLQYATAVVALFVPLAAGLYLLVSVAWTLVQRVILRRVYPPV